MNVNTSSQAITSPTYRRISTKAASARKYHGTQPGSGFDLAVLDDPASYPIELLIPAAAQ